MKRVFRSRGGLLTVVFVALTGCGKDGDSVPCSPGCPEGYSCTEGDICTGGSPRGLVLDLKMFEVEGRFVRDGAPIRDSTCTQQRSGYGGLAILSNSFLELRSDGARYYVNFACSESEGWTFQGWVPPGEYQVMFRPEADSSQGGVSWTSALSVRKDQKGWVFDLSQGRLRTRQETVAVPEPAAGIVSQARRQEAPVEVSGTLTRNGEQLGQLTDCGHYIMERALPNEPSPLAPRLVPPEVALVAEGGDVTLLPLKCGDNTTGSDAWTFSGSVIPGTYRVELRLDYATHVFDSRLQTTSPVLSRVPGPVHVLVPRLQVP